MLSGFASRLDYVMGVTRTTNSSLARALSFDASYVCRIRNGKRGLPMSQPFAEPAAAYLVGKVDDARKRRALEDELGCAWPDDPAKAADLLAAWLLDETGGASAVGTAIAALGARPENGRGALGYDGSDGLPDAREATGMGETDASQARFFYGDEGKREAVLAFLGEICDAGEPQTLLLHSDEDMAWLYEDEAFARRWAALLMRIADAGGHVRIIHAVSRDANEMWEAVRKWMPLYMTGAVEPYYYPRLRDGIYRRTLFVAPGRSALVAASVRGTSHDGANLLVRDEGAVAAYEDEFDDYLALCRPLMRVTFPESAVELSALVGRFCEREGRLLASLDGETLVCAHEGAGALVANVGAPLVAFGIEEPRMVSAVCDYLDNLPKSMVARDAAAHRLLAEL